jgi:hypothetical protein
MSTDEYTTVRLPKELIDEIDQILKLGLKGYKSRAELIKEAIRDKLKTFPPMPEQAPVQALPPIEHFNIDENGVRILDRTIANGGSNGRIIDVYFKQDRVWCEHCQSADCRHVKFALTIPKVQETLRQKGWKLNREK